MMTPESDPPVILVVEDEPAMHRLLSLLLKANGYRVLSATTGEEASIRAAETPPDLVILDLGLPDLDGIEFIRRLRTWHTGHVLVVSARNLEKDKVEALDEGANDFLTKPFGSAELLARVRVGLRNGAMASVSRPVIEIAGLRVDLERREVLVDGTHVSLTPLEFRLLVELVRHAGKVLTHRHLLLHVWGPDAVGRNHYVRVFMANLRAKLGDDATRPRWIHTLQGIGYRVDSPDTP
jgi:two-component system KDP operon response regulator KdpE